MLGAAGAGTGTAAVFITDNQVGTAALFVLAIALLLMGLQGTPITRFGLGENGSVEYADALGKELIQKSQEAATPDAAEAYLDAAFRASPAAALTPASRYVTYETLLMRALEDLAGETAVHRLQTDDGTDFTIRTSATGRIDVVAKYFEFAGAKSTARLRSAIERAAERKITPVLIVSNIVPPRLFTHLQDLNDGSRPSVALVEWNGPSDNPRLLSALDSLRAASE